MPAGYARLIERHRLRTVLPYRIHVVAATATNLQTQNCTVHPRPRWPGSEDIDHLVFALKYEGVNLLILKQVFAAAGPDLLNAAIAAKPTSAYVRRLCFFHEWLGLGTLNAPAALGGAYAAAIDERHQYATAESENVRRWRVRDNLPGTAAFCPLVTRTQRIDRWLSDDLSGRVEATIGAVPPELIHRASAFLLLNDSKASFEIESERPSRDRARRWAEAIGRAGETALSTAMFVELQRDLIEDDRFVTLGLRTQGGFVGQHTPLGEPRPDHISAPPDAIEALLDGLVAFDDLSRTKLYDPVLSAASLAFGFVYVHPFEDGNGRIHRYLIHHVLARHGFLPDGATVPVSVSILEDLVGYRGALESVSRPMLTVIDWQPTERGNVDVRGDVRFLYETFDATPHVEFLFARLERAIDTLLPDELRFLTARDDFHRAAGQIVDMPERTVDLVYQLLRQNSGRFSKRMRVHEFAPLTDAEVAALETAFDNATRVN